MYQILQKVDIHWHDGGPSIALMYHLRTVSDLLCNWKSCLLCYMKDVVLHCSIFFKWNKSVRVRARVRVRVLSNINFERLSKRELCHQTDQRLQSIIKIIIILQSCIHICLDQFPNTIWRGIALHCARMPTWYKTQLVSNSNQQKHSRCNIW